MIRASLAVVVFVAVLAAFVPVTAQTAPPTPTVPENFDVTIFARPPKVNYPVCLAAAPTGEVFVGVDRQGSLGRKTGEGMVVRCTDSDGDGQADQFTTFAKMDHPRGLIYDQGKLWVLHPPFLTLYHDDNGDGVADRSETLVTGLSTEQVSQRGGDHTTNGIRLGIDGWIYIAMGDFGCLNAKGKDGRTLTLKGGGVVRVRPDGTEMELFARGLRNILDVAIDPQLNMFTRDNTNDGGGWDIRLSHIIQSANYGYPTLFKNFADEIMPPLADYGGGSGCGSLFVSEPWLPKPFAHALFTCDWGRSAVYYHPLTADGPTYQAKQEIFATIPRPTDMDVDGSGRLYISSWHNGGFNYSGENVGFVAQVKPKKLDAPAFPDLPKLSDGDLLQQLRSDSHVRRLHSQREILRRGQKPALVQGLTKLLHSDASVSARVAAIFTCKQLLGAAANRELTALAADAAVREYALRALTDRQTQLDDVPVELFIRSLSDDNPRVRLAAAIGLGRLGDVKAAPALLPLAALPKEQQSTAQEPAFQSKQVKGKQIVKVDASIRQAKKLFLVVTDGGNGNGLDHAAWLEPRLVGPAGTKKLTELPWSAAEAGWGKVHKHRDCENHPLRIGGKTIEDCIGTHAFSIIAYDLPPGYERFQARAALDDGSNGKGQVDFLVFTDTLPSSLRPGSNLAQPERVLPHVAVKSLVALHAVDACLQALDGPYRAGALRALRYMHDPRAVSGLIEHWQEAKNPELRQDILRTLIRLYHREAEYKGTWWGTRPDTTGPYYHRETWSESPHIEAVIRKALDRADAAAVKRIVAELDRHRVELKNLPAHITQQHKTGQAATPDITVTVPKFDPNNPRQIGNIPLEKVLADALQNTGKVKLGARLFQQQSCIACHTIQAGQPPLGPQLVDIGKRYNRKQLLESILKPSAQIAQGFTTHVFVMNDGKTHTGFVVREGAEDVEVRTSEGKSLVLHTGDIEERIPSQQSIMPEGLVNNLTVPELAALVDYLDSLRSP